MSVDHRTLLAVSMTCLLLGLAFRHAPHRGYTNRNYVIHGM